MKKLLVFTLFGASMQAMDKMDLRTSAELIRSLVEGDLEVAGNQISTPQGQRYTLDMFHEGLKDHGVIIENGTINIVPANDYAKNLALFFANVDIVHLLEQGAPVSDEAVETIIMRREQLLHGLVSKDPFTLMSGLQGPLHIDELSLQ